MLLLDGPMGTALAARGVATPAPGWSAYAIDAAPEVVREIHRSYALADVHRTNTFRTQPRLFLEYRRMNHEAVELARGKGRVAGVLAPIEDCYRPDLSPLPEEARPLHRAMAESLRDAGVDLLLAETFPHGGEARIAVEECVRTGLETWIALTAGPYGKLMTPAAMEEAARACVGEGAKAVLVNCSPVESTIAYVERLARLGVACGAYANSFEASDVERYMKEAERWVSAGATIVGGCCGTTAEHLAALAELRLPSLAKVNRS
jgi:S-methylmethionine-dependent homocysteine/selenocysteine methylase